MDWSHKHDVEWKKPGKKRVYVGWFNWHEIQKRVKRMYAVEH